MKKIKLSQGKHALIDDLDYEFLNQWKWYASKSTNTFYAKRSISNKRIVLRMHRIIMDAKKGQFIDHKDGNGLNNQRNNLRFCTQSQNYCNRRSVGTSKYLGVSWDKTNKIWRAAIRINGKTKHLGGSQIEKECAILYNISARKYHGEFANPNKFV